MCPDYRARPESPGVVAATCAPVTATPTFIGALLIPLLLFPALYWTNGYFFGTLASVVRADLEAAAT
jgi:hypothetical protein